MLPHNKDRRISYYYFLRKCIPHFSSPHLNFYYSVSLKYKAHKSSSLTNTINPCSKTEEVADRKGTRFLDTKDRMGWESSLGIEHVPSMSKVLDQSPVPISINRKSRIWLYKPVILERNRETETEKRKWDFTG